MYFVVSPCSPLSLAHCLHTVTEDNAELLCSMSNAVLGTLESVLLSSQADMAHTLLRTLAAGMATTSLLSHYLQISFTSQCQPVIHSAFIL